MRKTILLVLLFTLVAIDGRATLAEPEHIFFGVVRNNGVIVTSGTVSVRINGDTADAATYALGSIIVFGNRYVLRVPLSSVVPRIPGTAQQGDQAAFYVNNQLAGAATVGDRGTPQEVDLDLNFQGVPALSTGDFTLAEGDGGITNATVVVSIGFATNRPVTFNFATANLTAFAGSDYVAASGLGTIATGQTTTTVVVGVNGDTTPEAAESFLVNVSNLSGATAGDLQGVVTILDDDTVPSLSIGDASAVETDSVNRTMQFTVSMTNVRANAVSVDYTAAGDTATAGSDFTAANGTLSIPAGSLSATIDITILPDNVIEADERLVVTLSNPAGATLGDGTGIGTIVDDDRVLTMVEVQKDGVASVSGLTGISSLAVSPRGEHLYAAAQTSNSVVVFSRNATSGRLTFVEALSGISGMTSPRAVAVSADGKHAYAGSAVDAAIVVFSRNESTGRLTFVEVQKSGIAGVLGLGGLGSLALSADGLNLVAASSGDDAVTVFSRDSSTGRLSFVEAHFDGVAGVNGLDGASSIAVSNDGTSVYAGSSGDSAIAVFRRSISTGRLSFLGTAPTLLGISSVAVTVDGKHVIAGAQLGDGIAVFSRDAATGTLTSLSTFTNLLNGVEGLNGVAGIAAARDGRFVYAASIDDSALAVFSRDPSNGALMFREAERDGAAGVDGLAGAAAVAVSPDSRFIYAAGSAESAIAVLELTEIGARPDANGDGVLSVGDIFYLVSYIFSGGPPPVGRGDMNGDGNVSVGDIFYLINHFFSGGPPPL